MKLQKGVPGMSFEDMIASLSITILQSKAKVSPTRVIDQEMEIFRKDCRGKEMLISKGMIRIKMVDEPELLLKAPIVIGERSLSSVAFVSVFAHTSVVAIDLDHVMIDAQELGMLDLLSSHRGMNNFGVSHL